MLPMGIPPSTVRNVEQRVISLLLFTKQVSVHTAARELGDDDADDGGIDVDGAPPPGPPPPPP
eukprot:gene41494-1719_t